MPGVSKIENDKSFEYYCYLSPEQRMMLVNAMETAGRHFKEATSSNSFMNALKLVAVSKDLVYIYIEYIDFQQAGEDTVRGYCLEFEREDGATYMIYTPVGRNDGELWRSQISDLTDLIEIAIQEFRRILISNQNIVRKLIIEGRLFGNRLQNVDFQIDSLRNVTEIRIAVDVNISQFISRTILPLDVLSYKGHHNVQNVENFEMMYEVQKKFQVINLSLNKNQFFRLSASYIDVHIGNLTEEDVFEYIQSWQNGERNHLEFCRWNLKSSNFNVQTFLDLFEGSLIEDEEDQIFTVTQNITKQLANWFLEDEEVFDQWALVFEVTADYETDVAD